MIIEATNIHKSFGSLEVLKGIDLSVAPREIISIVGASGAGKKTLLQILGTLEAPASGASLKICGQEVTSLSARRQAELRNRQIGFIFQSHQLLPEFTALENVMLPALIAGEPRVKVRELFFDLRDELGQTFVIVTHDPEFAAQADRMIVLRDGRIEAIHTRPTATTEGAID